MNKLLPNSTSSKSCGELRERERPGTITPRKRMLDSAGHVGLSIPLTDETRRSGLFDTLPKLMRPEQFAEHFGYSVATIYDWRYRGVLRGVPSGLFLSLNRRLYIRTDVFWTWIASQNPDVESGTK